MRLKTSEFLKIELRPNSGASVDAMIKEAMITAVEYGCNVDFKFNDAPYEISYIKLVSCVKTRAN